MRKLGFFIWFTLTACSQSVKISNNQFDSISGSITGVSSSSLNKTSNSIFASCQTETVKLYSLTSTGNEGDLLGEATIDSDGKYSFENLSSQGVLLARDQQESTKYLLRFNCGTEILNRYVTGPIDQNIDFGTTIVSWIGQTQIGSKVTLMQSDVWKNLYVELQKATSVEEAYNLLINTVSIKKKFKDNLDVDPEVLGEAAPMLRSFTVPSSFNEDGTNQLSALVHHWSPNYDFAYEWRLNGVLISNSINFNYSPTANKQGSYTLQLFVGKNNGSGLIDTTKPYVQKLFDVSINNNILPLTPNMTLVSNSITASSSQVVRLSTGSVSGSTFQNCRTFSHLALVEESSFLPALPPTNANLFSYDCTQAVTQDITYISSGAQGSRALRLWAIDDAGAVSALSSEVVFTYDTVSPSLSIATPAANTEAQTGMTIGGTCESGLTITLTGSGITPTTASCISSSFSAAVSFTTGDGIKGVTASQTDAAGNTISVTRNFVKDTTAPLVAILTPSASTEALLGVTITGTCEDGLNLNLSGTGIVATSTTCSGGHFSAPIQFTSGDGSKTVVVAQTDLAGNTGTDTRNFIKDSASPTLAFISPAALTPAQNTLTINGTCESGLSVSLSGTGINSTTTTCSSGAFSSTVTFTSGDGNKDIVISQTDTAGNIGLTSRIFVKDTTSPILSFTSPAVNTEAQTGVSVSGNCESGLTVHLAGTGISAIDTNCTSGSFNQFVTFTSGDGSKIITAAQTDAAGNTGSTSRDFIKDTLAPVVSITTPSTNATVPLASTLSSLTLAGSCENGLTVNLSGALTASTSCSSGAWSITVDITAASEGVLSVVATQTDSASNTGSASRTVIKDTTAPVITITSAPSSNQMGGSTVSIGFSVTETNITTSQSFSVSYSSDSGASWTDAGSVTSLAGPLSAQSFSYNLTLPTINSSQFKVKIVGTDMAGNSSNSAISNTFTVDSAAPTISSFSLAGGATSVAMFNVTYAISASDALSSISQMRFSETSSFADTGWIAYSATGSTSITALSGQKTIYVWLKDSVGNISNVAQYDIFLDYGSPPTVTLTSPIAGSTYSAGNNVPVGWSCASTNGLDALPVRLTYTADEGSTFNSISGGWIANSGTYNWTLPSGVSVFRLLVECKSAAGVVSSSYSGAINATSWSIYAGDPTNASENVSTSTALMYSAGNVRPYQSIASDSQGNIFYEFGKTIMKVDALSGTVTRFAGTPGNSSCTIAAGQDPLSSGTNYIGSPYIIGTNQARTEILFLTCNKIFSMNTSTRVLTLWHSSPPGGGNILFYSLLGKLYYRGSNNLIYQLNLQTANATPLLIYGNNTCSSSNPVNGTLATNTPAFGANNSSGAPDACNEIYLIANSTDTELWIGAWGGYGGTPNAAKFTWDPGQSAFVVSNGNTGWRMDWNLGFCVPSRKTGKAYCSSRHNTSMRSVFNPTTGTWAADVSMGVGSIFIRYAATDYGMVSLDSINRLMATQENDNGSLTISQIGGQNIETYGNGTNPSAVAFSAVGDVSYAPGGNFMLARTASGSYMRKFDFSTSPATVSTISYNYPDATKIVLNSAGNKLIGVRTWCTYWPYIGTWNSGSQIYNNSLEVYHLLGCNAGTNIAAPVADNTAASLNMPWANWYYVNSRPLIHSNGQVYFFIKNRTLNQDAFIYSSNNTTIKLIAGKVGAVGYNSADNSNASVGANLNEVRLITETSTGDLLIVDNNRVRLITITTESPTPKIYDIANLSLAAGYVNNTTDTIVDATYDASTEILQSGVPVKGSGTLYYVTSGLEVRKYSPSSVAGGVVTAATDTAYSFAGTTLSGDVRIALSPAGLLVTQPSKARILRVQP